MMTRMDEIAKVNELGARIGYGNLMDIASALWAKSEGDTSENCEGSYSNVPMGMVYLTEEGKTTAKQNLKIRIDEIEHLEKEGLNIKSYEDFLR